MGSQSAIEHLMTCGRGSASDARVGEPYFASWNQLDGWLLQVEGLRFDASPVPAVARNSSQDLPA